LKHAAKGRLFPSEQRLTASWLHQVESYFSVVQPKVLSPNDFDSPPKLEAALLCFQERYEKIRHSVPMELHPRGVDMASPELWQPDPTMAMRHLNSEWQY